MFAQSHTRPYNNNINQVKTPNTIQQKRREKNTLYLDESPNTLHSSSENHIERKCSLRGM